MSRQEELIIQIYRLVHVARSVGMKRAVTSVNSNPSLDFWRLILGNQLDIAIIEWCKVFGSNAEATHWKKIIPGNKHGQFRTELLSTLGVTSDAWDAYWTEMKTYKDTLGAHHIETNKSTEYPVLDLALKSSCIYYEYLMKELRTLGETSFPDVLDTYATEFEKQAREIAKEAMSATEKFKESVVWQ